MIRHVALATAALAFCAGQAVACLVCIELPERTITDRVLAAETVVLARNNPDRPFAFAPVETLNGDAAGEVIPGLVDSQTRRRLAADPDVAVLFARDADGWARLSDVTPQFRMVLSDILAAADAWDAGASHTARFAFFAALHDHADPAVRALALAELSRAPYAQIRGIHPRLGRAEVTRLLLDPKMTEWVPIHILFLGLSDDPQDHAFVRRAFDAASRSSASPHLAAWATALVEIDGPPAIERIRAMFFQSPGRTPEEMRAIATALATLAEGGETALRPGIDAAFRDLAAEHTALAGEAARYLTWAGDWSQADSLGALLLTGAITDPAAEFLVTNYIAAAREAHDPTIR
jgi:hypothetical protein